MVYIILGQGFEETEAIAPYDILKRGEVNVAFAGIGGREISGGHGICVKTETTVDMIDAANAEMIVIPGGLGGVKSILGSPAAMDAVKISYNAGREIAAICAGPLVLAELGILSGKNAVCYPGMEGEMDGGKMTQEFSAVSDGNVTTGRGPGAALDFGLKLLEKLKGKETADRVAADMYYERR